MGCKNTKNASFAIEQTNGEVCDKNVNCNDIVDNSQEDIESQQLTARQKELVLETWKPLVDNISTVGVITFMNLFETHPDVQDVFMSFKGLSKEDLRHSKELRAHGLRVMGFVQKVVARLDEPYKAEQLLRELGSNHVMYGARRDYVDLIGPQFVFSVKPSLQDHWSDEAEEAWLQLFRYIACVMKHAMAEKLRINPAPPEAPPAPPVDSESMEVEKEQS